MENIVPEVGGGRRRSTRSTTKALVAAAGDPVPGCKMCKLYARPGLHIYRSIHMETHMESEETPVKKSSRSTPHFRATPYARTSSRARRNSTVELEEEVEEIKEKEEEEENQCGNCGMAFDTEDLLETHE